MSIRRLPPVLCFHAKRFEHHLAGGGRKLDTPLQCVTVASYALASPCTRPVYCPCRTFHDLWHNSVVRSARFLVCMRSGRDVLRRQCRA